MFGPDGYLSRTLPGYAPRASQVALARAIYETIEAGIKDAAAVDPLSLDPNAPPPDEITQRTVGRLIAEAPCGTGKSIAYLTVATYFALRYGARIVVATANNALLEQLLSKDLPFLASALPWPVRFSGLVGRRNYACLMRLHGDDDEPSLFKAKESYIDPELAKLLAWARTTQTGDRSELPTEPHPLQWARISVGADDCTRDGCAHRNECYANKAKQKAGNADVIVTNFAMYCLHAEMRMRTRNHVILPEHRIAIFDEVHELDRWVRDGFGQRLSVGSFTKIARWATKNDAPGAGQTVKLLADAFFESALTYASGSSYRVRLTTPGWIDPAPLVAATGVVSALARRAAKDARSTIVKMGLDADEKELRPLRRVAAQANNTRIRAERAAAWVLEVANLSDAVEVRAARWAATCAATPGVGQPPHDEDPANGKVYWIDVKEENGPPRASIEARPLFVSGILQSQLWGHASLASVIGLSATLRTEAATSEIVDGQMNRGCGRGWEHARTKLGIPGTARAITVPSPFDMGVQARLVLPVGMPSPTPPDGASPEDRIATDRAYDTAVAEVTERVIRAVGGRTLALFTSRRAMDAAHTHARGAGLPYTILRQGDVPRGELVRQFKADPTSVAFGVASLGTGVDIPGDALQALVLSKCTFGMPDDPVANARDAYRAGLKQNSFNRDVMPEMLLTLRQWAGRLIRDVDDVGIVVLCDPRVVSAAFGKRVLAALGFPVVLRDIAEAEQWLASVRNKKDML